MGEGNAVVNRSVSLRMRVESALTRRQRRPRLKEDTLLAAASIYKGELRKVCSAASNLTESRRRLAELHGHEDGTIPATFQIMHMVSRSILMLRYH